MIARNGVAWLNAAPISDTDRALVYHENAERIFHIDAKP